MTNSGFIDFAKTREALDFPIVLQHYRIETTGTGAQLKARCPFHAPDNKPSCGINTDKKAFNCFSCHTKGNILEFVALMEDLDPANMAELKQAAEVGLEAIMGLDPADFRKGGLSAQKPQKGSGRTKRAAKAMGPALGDKRRTAGRTAPQAAPEKSDSVRENPILELELTLDPEHAFFAEREIDPEAVATFGLGYCARGMMKNRIAIPIHNERGELVAYAGRWSDDQPPDDKERYKLPKRFFKSLVLYNLHRAKQIGGRHVVLVEGYWSTMRLHLAGIPCVSCMGTSVSTDQAELIKASGFRFVTVIFDGDQSGLDGLDISLPILGKAGLYARAVILDDGVKPDTMSENIVASLKPS